MKGSIYCVRDVLLTKPLSLSLFLHLSFTFLSLSPVTGGLVARTSFFTKGRTNTHSHTHTGLVHPSVSSLVSRIITLNSPHTAPPISLQRSMGRVFSAVNNAWKCAKNVVENDSKCACARVCVRACVCFCIFVCNVSFVIIRS